MVARLLARLSSLLFFNHPHFLSPRILNPHLHILRPIVSPVFHSRRFSDVAQQLPRDVVSAEETLEAPKYAGNSGGPRASLRSSLNEAELAKFSAIAETWWDAEGPFKPLHALNPTRLGFLRSTLCHHFRKDPDSAQPFEGLRFVDVGCGGGILSEPLAQMGATITGIDAVDKNIKIARLHAELDPTTSAIEFLCTTAGDRACGRSY